MPPRPTGRDKRQTQAKTRDTAQRSKRDVALNKAQQKRDLPAPPDKREVAKIDKQMKELQAATLKLKKVAEATKELEARTLDVKDEEKRLVLAEAAAKRSADVQKALMALLRKVELANREMAKQQKAYQSIKVGQKLPPPPVPTATIDVLTIALVLAGMGKWWAAFKKKVL